jgi:hypothetical protein
MKTTSVKKPVVLLTTVILTSALAGCQPTKVDEAPEDESNETNDPSVVDERGDGQGCTKNPSSSRTDARSPASSTTVTTETAEFHVTGSVQSTSERGNHDD